MRDTNGSSRGYPPNAHTGRFIGGSRTKTIIYEPDPHRVEMEQTDLCQRQMGLERKLHRQELSSKKDKCLEEIDKVRSVLKHREHLVQKEREREREMALERAKAFNQQLREERNFAKERKLAIVKQMESEREFARKDDEEIQKEMANETQNELEKAQRQHRELADVIKASQDMEFYRENEIAKYRELMLKDEREYLRKSVRNMEIIANEERESLAQQAKEHARYWSLLSGVSCFLGCLVGFLFRATI